MALGRLEGQKSKVAALAALAAFGIAIGDRGLRVSSADPKVSKSIVSITKGGVDLQVPPDVPPPGKGFDLRWQPSGAPSGETWRYGRVMPFQVAAGVAGVFLNIQRK